MHPDETVEHDSIYTLPHTPLSPGETTKKLPPGAPPLVAPAPASPMRLGPYRIERELARGGMGVVYEAEHEALRRRVALKVMRGSDPEELERFLIEARAVARLKHPHIVAVHDVGQDGARWYLAMDLVDGESLKRRVERDGALPPTEAARVVGAVARALHHAHTRGILHRDVKPHNVLIARDGAVALADFGLAKDVAGAESGITVSGQIMGTPAYMAPEQAGGEGARVDRRSDVYGAGATLYELLTGAPPFSGPTLVNVLHRVITTEPVPPRRARPELDHDLETICLKCLDKDPLRRYDTAGELADDLARWARREPIAARPITARERLQKWARHRPRLALSIVAAGLVLCLSAAGAIGAWAAERRRIAVDQATKRAAFAGAWAEVVADDRDPTRNELARLTHDRRAFESAAAWVEAAPDEPDAAGQLAAAAMRLGDHARWSDDFREASRAYEVAAGLEHPDRERAARLLEWCRVVLRASDERVDLNAGTAGGTELDELIARFPEIGQSWLLRFRLRWRRNDHVGAAADARQATRLEPVNPWAWEALSSVYAGHDVDQVLRDGLARCPTWSTGWAALTRACLRVGRHEEALAAAEELIKRSPELANHHGLRAHARQTLGDLAGAAADLEAAIARAPQRAPYWKELARVQTARGDVAAGLRVLDRFVERSPGLGAAWRERAAFKIEVARDYEGAIADCDRATALDPDDVRADTFRGLALLRLERWDQAHDVSARVLSIHAGEPQAHLVRGVARLNLGRLEEGRRDLQRFLQLAPDHPQALDVRRILQETAR